MIVSFASFKNKSKFIYLDIFQKLHSSIIKHFKEFLWKENYNYSWEAFGNWEGKTSLGGVLVASEFWYCVTKCFILLTLIFWKIPSPVFLYPVILIFLHLVYAGLGFLFSFSELVLGSTTWILLDVNSFRRESKYSLYFLKNVFSHCINF